MSKDQEQIKKYINIAKGQLDGIIKMIDEDRYCLDVSDLYSFVIPVTVYPAFVIASLI